MPGVLLLGGNALRLGGTVLTMGGVGGGGGGGSTVPASALAAVPGTTMAWDATVPANALSWVAGASPNIGAPLSQWAGAQVGGIANSISGQPRLRSVNGDSFSAPNLTNAFGVAAEPRARVNGGVAGIGPQSGIRNGLGTPWPGLDYVQSWVVENAVSLPRGQAWYIALAYSRPHLRTFGVASNLLTFGNYSGGAVPHLMTIDSVAPSTATGAGAATIRVLGQTVKTGIYPSYWGTALLVNDPTPGPNQGLKVYLDNSTTAVNSTPIALPGSWATTADYLGILGCPQANQGGQCYLHECAIGGPTGGATTISNAQIAAVMATFAARYQVGAAPTVMMVAVGQSNMGNSAGARGSTRPLMAYLTGALAFDWWSTNAQAPGRGLWTRDEPYNSGVSDSSYLTMWQNTTTKYTDAADYPLGTTGTTLIGDLSRSDVPIYLRGCLAGLFAYYSEDLSNLPYSALAQHAAAWRNFANQVRASRAAAVGAAGNASNFPVFYTELVAYFTGAEGNQMIADSFATLQSADGFRLSMPYSVDQSGTGAHAPDYTAPYTRGAYQLARDVMTARGLNAAAIPSGSGGVSRLGPSIQSAVWEPSTKSVLVTVQHDAGNDLNLPSLVQSGGLGFSMRTGWVSPSSRGTLVSATSAAKVSANQIRVFFSTAATTLPASSRLFYVEQGVSYAGNDNRVGAGNAVTDNAASVLPASHPIASDLGPGFALNMSLRWTPAGIPIS